MDHHNKQMNKVCRTGSVHDGVEAKQAGQNIEQPIQTPRQRNNAVVCSCDNQPSMHILLADREPVFLQGLRGILGSLSCIRFVDDALTRQEAFACLSSQQPQLFITGHRLACGCDVVGLASDLKSRSPDTIMIVLLPLSAGPLASRYISCGARGVLGRCAPPEDFLYAIGRVMGGEIFVDPRLSASYPHTNPDSCTARVNSSGLTTRELEIFRLIGMDHSCKEISDLLGISARTVESHRENIKNKMCIGSSKKIKLLARDYNFLEASAIEVPPKTNYGEEAKKQMRG